MALLNVDALAEWFTFGADFQHTGLGIGSGASGNLIYSSSPTGKYLPNPCILADHEIISSDSDGNVVDLNSDGTVKWSYSTSDSLSPVTIDVNGNVLVTSHTGYVYSINSSGSLNWKTATNVVLDCTPAIDATGNIIVSSTIGSSPSAVVISLSPTGSINWTYDGLDQSIPTPSIDLSGNIVVAGSEGDIQSISPSGKLNWTYKINDSLNDPVAIAPNGNIIVCSFNYGTMYSISPSGALNWKKTFSGENFGGNPTIDTNGNIVVCGSKTAHIYSVSSTGVLNWTYQSKTLSESGTAMDAKGNAITTDYNGNIYSISSTGHLNWSYSTGESFFWNPPSIDPNGRVVVPGMTGKLYIFD
jgi:hypothetical protein